MEINKLRIYKKVVDKGSVTRAAEEMHLAQPYVSRILTELEEELGHELFERKKGRRSTTPNKYGAVLLSTAKDTLRNIDALPQKLEALDLVIGRLYLSSYTELPGLSEALHAFRMQYPKILVHFVQPQEHLSPFNVESDLIISAQIEPRLNLQYHHLYRDHVVIILPEAYPEIHSLLDLALSKFILPSNHQNQYSSCVHLPTMAGFLDTPVTAAANADHMLSLIRADTTMSNVALWSAHELNGRDLTGVRIVEVPDYDAVRWINLAWRTDTGANTLIALLANHLIHWYSEAQ